MKRTERLASRAKEKGKRKQSKKYQRSLPQRGCRLRAAALRWQHGLQRVPAGRAPGHGPAMKEINSFSSTLSGGDSSLLLDIFFFFFFCPFLFRADGGPTHRNSSGGDGGVSQRRRLARALLIVNQPLPQNLLDYSEYSLWSRMQATHARSCCFSGPDKKEEGVLMEMTVTKKVVPGG